MKNLNKKPERTKPKPDKKLKLAKTTIAFLF